MEDILLASQTLLMNFFDTTKESTMATVTRNSETSRTQTPFLTPLEKKTVFTNS
jgi:hypothetical protein